MSEVGHFEDGAMAVGFLDFHGEWLTFSITSSSGRMRTLPPPHAGQHLDFSADQDVPRDGCEKHVKQRREVKVGGGASGN